MPKINTIKTKNIAEIIRKKRKSELKEVPSNVTINNLVSNKHYVELLKEKSQEVDEFIREEERKAKQEARDKAIAKAVAKYGNFFDSVLTAFKNDKSAYRKYSYAEYYAEYFKKRRAPKSSTVTEKQATAHGKTDHGHK
jgi:hypothetical protein